VKYSRDEIGIKKFGKRLKQIRLSKNMTQEELAWEAGIEPMQVSRIERGIINTGISQVFILSKALKVSPKELFDFDI
jgi:transcriptional regulator with XRE-family HTH domain